MTGEIKLLLVVAVLLLHSNVEGKSKNDVIDMAQSQAGCKAIKCSENLICPYGNYIDMDGCHTCNCRDLPVDYKVNYACPMPMCSHRCKRGRKVTDIGCETCTCM